MTPLKYSFVFLVISFNFINTSFACGLRQFSVKSVTNCNNDSIIKLKDGFKVEFDQNCDFILEGCVEFSPFNTYQMNFSLDNKPFTDINMNVDICKVLENAPIIGTIIHMFGFPEKCPVSASEVCGRTKMNFFYLRPFLGMFAGDFKVKLSGKHDTGETCINVTVSAY